jgi:hypothetical protein
VRTQCDGTTTMMLTRNLSITLLSVLVGAFPISSVYGCELHTGGDGMPQMMGFGYQHPLMQQHMLQTIPPVIEISITNRFRVAAAEQVSMEFKYTAPSLYHSLSLHVIGSEEVEVHEGDKEELESLTGKERILFTAKKPGSHTVTLNINAVIDDKPVSYSRVVNVNAV